jgi:hypothetical protein
MSYSGLYDRLDEVRDELGGEIKDLKDIAEVKPKDEDLAARIDWLEEARYHVTQAIDAINGAIGVS